MQTLIRRTLIAASAMSALALGAATSNAQSAAGPRWQAWIGCWTSVAADENAAVREFAGSAPTVCITPAGDADVVDVTTVAGGKVVSHTKIDASGRDRAVEATGCSGVQHASWSADERRVYLKSTATCEGMRTATSGILAISPTGEWLDVRGVLAGGGDNVRVARYRDVGIPSGLPAEIAQALAGRSMTSQSARVAAGAAVGTSAVIDALHSSDAAVVEAWLLERRQPFMLSARDLVSLADAGVPARVTDALIAVSYPKVFAIARSDARTTSDNDALVGRRIYVDMGPSYDPWGYGYSPYGYGYGSAYGYGNTYGRYGGYGYGYYYQPIIVLPGTTPPAHGRVDKRGYTRDDGARNAGSTTAQSQPSSSGSSSSGTASTGSTTSQPSSATSQPSSAPERTAKPRP